MGPILTALINLQSIERQLSQVKGKLRSRQNAVSAQQRRIAKAQEDCAALQDKILQRKKSADSLELDLKDKEAQVAKLRAALNTTKTNKEYAAVLTQINTFKADNAKVEEDVLNIRVEIDGINAEIAKAQELIQSEEKKLQDITQANAAECQRLEGMVSELAAKRKDAAAGIPAKMLEVFDRMSEQYDGEAMALIEIHGKRPPLEYVCGGCFMTLNAEHANALRQRDEIRNCGSCGRILYLPAKDPAATK